MKNMKGRFLRKLKTISTPTWNPAFVFQPNAPFQASNPDKDQHKNHSLPTTNGENISISETPLDIKEEALPSLRNADSEEKFLLSIKSNEGSIYNDPESKPDKVLAVTMHDHAKSSLDFNTSLEISLSPCPPPCLKQESTKDNKNDEKTEDRETLSLFEERCPPGGRNGLVLYTTSLRGIRKTFEDCNAIRFLLESFRVVYSERDVSMHLEYREELWKILGGRVVPPRLFIRGRYIGGADEVVGLHEKGMLKNLLEGIPLSPSRNPCGGCGGMRFVLCFSCNGSRKLMMTEGKSNEKLSMRCPDCNENGLVKCCICS